MTNKLVLLAFCGGLLVASACNKAELSGDDPNNQCMGRQCQVNRSCPVSTGPTTLTGTVTIPAGTLPLYNAKVFIPSGSAPQDPVEGVSCDVCQADNPNEMVASTRTDYAGRFTLQNVPSGSDIPLVIQVGKWQRVVSISNIADCTTTELSIEQTRLPRNRSEGHIPKISVTTGERDAIECLLRRNKLGLEDTEFTNPDGPGRVNLYAGPGGAQQYKPELNSGQAFPKYQLDPIPSWWDDLHTLAKYDIVMLACEGSSERLDNKTMQARANLQSYLNMGGRVFATHWQYVWIQFGPMPLSSVASFKITSGAEQVDGIINTGFARGKALADWLILPNVWQDSAPLPPYGQIPIVNTGYATASLNPNLTQLWVDYSAGSPPAENPQYFSFNAPVGELPSNQCGQMVFSNMHVASSYGLPYADNDYSRDSVPFPDSCNAKTLTPKEKALIFMLFDLTNCLQRSAG